MKRLHSMNCFYVIGTVPFILAMTGFTAMLVGQPLLRALIAAGGLGITLAVVRKFWWLPKPEKEYGEMEPFDLKLPVKFPVRAYLCPAMDRYGFLKRKVELISPLIRRRGEDFKVALSPGFVRQQGEALVRIAVMRELIRYRQGVQVKTSLGLITPALALASLIEAYFALGWNRKYPVAAGYGNFFGPVLIAVAAVCLLLAWNRSVSRMDFRVDDELKEYFPKEEVAAFIRKWDELMLPDEPELINEKSRELELFYIRQRVERL